MDPGVLLEIIRAVGGLVDVIAKAVDRGEAVDPYVRAELDFLMAKVRKFGPEPVPE